MKFQIISDLTKFLKLIKNTIGNESDLEQETNMLYMRAQSQEIPASKRFIKEYIIKNNLSSVLSNYLIHIDRDVYAAATDVLTCIDTVDMEMRFIGGFHIIPARDIDGNLTNKIVTGFKMDSFKERASRDWELDPLQVIKYGNDIIVEIPHDAKRIKIIKTDDTTSLQFYSAVYESDSTTNKHVLKLPSEYSGNYTIRKKAKIIKTHPETVYNRTYIYLEYTPI